MTCACGRPAVVILGTVALCPPAALIVGVRGPDPVETPGH